MVPREAKEREAKEKLQKAVLTLTATVDMEREGENTKARYQKSPKRDLAWREPYVKARKSRSPDTAM